jgi:hypothetical protein
MTQTAVSNTALTTLVKEFLGPLADAAQDESSALLSSGELRRQEGMKTEWTCTVWPPGGQGIIIADNGRLPNGVATIQGLARQMPNAIVDVISQGAIAADLQINTAEQMTQLNQELKQRASAMGKRLARMVVGGTASPNATGTNWSGTAANSTLTACPFDDISLFEINCLFDWVSATSSLSYRVRCTDVASAAGVATSALVAGTVSFINDDPNPATGSVVAFGSATILTTDIFALPGTYAGYGGSATALTNGPVSFDTYITAAAGTLVHGLSPTANPQLNWRSPTRALSTTFSQEAVLGFKALIKQRGGGVSTTAFMHDQVAAALQASTGVQGSTFGFSAANVANRPLPLAGSNPDKYGSMNSKSFTIIGMTGVAESNCPAGRVVCFDKAQTQLGEWKKLGPRDIGDSGAVYADRTFYSNGMQIDARVSLLTNIRASVGALTGITGL